MIDAPNGQSHASFPGATRGGACRNPSQTSSRCTTGARGRSREENDRTGNPPWTYQTDGPGPRQLHDNMSTDEAAGHREEGEYGRAAKRLKTDEPGPEDELEEGEDSDSGSLPGNGETAESRARWRGGQKVRNAGTPDDTSTALQRQGVRARALAFAAVVVLSEGA